MIATNEKKFGLLLIIVLVAMSRILPHPPNFSPVMALGLLGGAYCLATFDAFALVFGAMLLSDAVIGFHPSLPAVYISLALAIFCGRKLRDNRGLLSIALATLASSVGFFVITNFSAWLELPEYPKTITGLMASYTAALPFFRNSLLGDITYVAILFFGMSCLERTFSARAQVLANREAA